LRRILLIAFALLALLVSSVGVVIWQPPARDAVIWFLATRLDTPPSNDPTSVRFDIREGENGASIAARLEAEQLIRSAWLFRLIAKLRGVDSRLQAGEYTLRRNMTANQIIDELQQGRFLGSMVTVPEGWRAEEIADLLEKRGIASRQEFLDLVSSDRSDARLARAIPPGLSLEGYLFPDTYRVPPQITAAEIVHQMIRNFDNRFPDALAQRASAQGLDLHQTVTLASIVEREAVLPSERPLIAGVYLNRLRDGMKLQADPTVQYAVASLALPNLGTGSYWKQSLSSNDLTVDSPYNTYRYTGLPPGPICNPGLASLMAVVEAQKTDYYYFVARPDGSHDFSRTLEEHERKVRQYQGGG